jgi:hypothetical protein
MVLSDLLNGDTQHSKLGGSTDLLLRLVATPGRLVLDGSVSDGKHVERSC